MVRFKKDDGSNYPDWEDKKIKDVCTVTNGKGNTQDKVDDGKYPFYVRSENIESSNKYIFDCEAVITSGDGVGVGKIFHYINGKFNLHQRCYAMYDFNNVIVPYFYYYFSSSFYKRVKRLTAKGSVDSVRLNFITDMNIPVPSIEEQQKIANFLTDVDELILYQEQEIKNLQEQKKGVLQKLFNQEVRFSADDGSNYPNWEENKLEYVVDVYDGTHQTPHYVDKGVKFVSVENINDLYGSNKFITQKAYDSDFKIRPDIGDVLMTRIGDIGTASLVTKDDPLAFYVSLALLKCKSINGKYLLQYINSDIFQSELRKRTLHTAYPKKINKGDIGKCLALIPCLEEQQKIAMFLSDLDDAINYAKQELENWNNIKKGLLQKMFI